MTVCKARGPLEVVALTYEKLIQHAYLQACFVYFDLEEQYLWLIGLDVAANVSYRVKVTSKIIL